MGTSYDHYIYAAHMRKWATENRVTVLRRGERKPRLLDIGKAVAAERGLNAPSTEAAYGKVEDLFNRALPRLIDPMSKPTDRDWKALREYAVLVHDRYPVLRGLAADEHGLSGGNAMMVPNPAHWGSASPATNPVASLATSMDREQLKAARLQLLPLSAQYLPPMTQILHVGPMLLGDAGIHAITFHPEPATARAYVAMPLTPGAMVAFGDQIISDEEGLNLARILNLKLAMESTVVVDTLEAPVITGMVAEMWKHQVEPSGAGLPNSLHLWSRIEDVPKPR